jgi:membrane protein DedA with SNARE-associated domain
MLGNIWQILGMVTAGGLLWLSIIFFLAMLGEMGLPVTCPVLESLLIFTGFQVAHGAYFVASLPFLAIAGTGRLCGSTSTYWLSSSLGSTIVDKFGRHIRITRERLDWVRQKLGSFTLSTIITARFLPGFTIASSIACGVSRIHYKNFFTAVTLHVLAWEAIFLTMGALGGRVSKSFSPESYPTLLVVWIVVAIIIAAAVGYFLSRRIRSKG